MSQRGRSGQPRADQDEAGPSVQAARRGPGLFSNKSSSPAPADATYSFNHPRLFNLLSPKYQFPGLVLTDLLISVGRRLDSEKKVS